MLFYNLRYIVNIYPGIEGSLGIDDHNGAQGTQTEAAGTDYLDFLFQTHALDVVFQCPYNTVTAGGGTAGASAHQYM